MQDSAIIKMRGTPLVPYDSTSRMSLATLGMASPFEGPANSHNRLFRKGRNLIQRNAPLRAGRYYSSMPRTTAAESAMAFSSEFARVGLVTVVAAILGINTLTSLLPSSDVKAPPVGGPPLYQAAALPIGPEPAAARIALTDARPQPAQVTPAAAALLMLPQTGPAADRSTTGLAPLPEPMETSAPPPVVAEAEASPKPEKRAAAPKRAKQVRMGHGSTSSASPKPSNQLGARPPVYTHAVQMSVY